MQLLHLSRILLPDLPVLGIKVYSVVVTPTILLLPNSFSTHKHTPTASHAILAWVASTSMRFRSKEQGTRVKDRAKNGASKRAERGWVRKEGNACGQTPGFWKLPTWPVMPEYKYWHLMLSRTPLSMKQSFDRHMTILFEPISRCVRQRTQIFKVKGFVCKRFLPSPPPLSFFDSHFISRTGKTGLSLIRNQMETLASQANAILSNRFGRTMN